MSLRYLFHDLGKLLVILFIKLMWNLPGRLVRLRSRRSTRSKGVLYIDFLGGSGGGGGNVRIPDSGYHFAYKYTPVSGNVINGLGCTTRFQPREIFHSSGRQKIAWQALERFYRMTTSSAEVRTVLRIMWENRRAAGPVVRKKIPVPDPLFASDQVKEFARQCGACMVGIAPLEQEFLFADIQVQYANAISFGAPMDLNSLRTAPSEGAGLAVLQGYLKVTRIATALAESIRQMGWRAKAVAGLDTADVLHIPLAIRAGLGELGKHGSLVTGQVGSNVRLGAVFTDLPLASTEPVDLGVDDFCSKCQRCLKACPPRAILPEKQTVRGEKKWYVDFDKCIPHFVANHGCGICIAVCPWSQPGMAVKISAKVLARRAQK